jgi:1-acyl-sn-glycerol-3-phosphate acyltransferase
MEHFVRRGVAGKAHNAIAPVVLHGGFWVRPLCRLLATVYFGRPRVVGRANLPIDAALLASNHRSGMIDGMLLANVAPRWTFMVGANLARHPILRHFVAGLVVERAADQARLDPTERAQRRVANLEALDGAAAFVAAGGALCVFPEGTSALGPSLLPLHPGVAAIYHRLCLLDAQAPLIPVGLHYAHGPSFRGLVEVSIGAPIDVQLDDRLSPAEQRQAVLDQLRAALEAITVNVRDADEQRCVEGLATLATAGTRLPHGPLCRALARGLATNDQAALDLREDWQLLESAQLLHFSGAPLYPRRSLLTPALTVLLLGPIVGAAALLNAPIIVAAQIAAKRQADAANVVALWRLLAGTPAALLWWPILGLLLGMLALPLIPAAFALTFLGLLLWRPWRIAATMLANAVLAPTLAPAVALLRKETLQWFASQTSADG